MQNTGLELAKTNDGPNISDQCEAGIETELVDFLSESPPPDIIADLATPNHLTTTIRKF